ncbi:MAG: radical SAM protein [Bdellovibrionota bacterium]
MLPILSGESESPSVDRHAKLYELRQQVTTLVTDCRYVDAIHLIEQRLPKLYLMPHGFGDLVANPSHDVRNGYRAQADHVTLLDSLFCETRTHQLEVLRQMSIETPDYRAGINLLTLKLLEAGAAREALELARSCFESKQNCVYSEAVLGETLRKVCEEGIPEDLKLSDVEESLLEDFSQFYCPKAFTNFEVFRTGEVFVCCGSLLPASIGNVYDSDFKSIWNSDAAQKIRASIHDGSFRYCSRTCTNIRTKNLPLKRDVEALPQELYRSSRISNNKLLVLQDGPKTVNLAHDYTCNLSCPSCRRGMKSADSKRREALDQVFERGISPLLAHTRDLQIAGDGDPFASKHYRQILSALSVEKYPTLKLRLLTNGVLFDENEWNNFANIHPLLADISISIDAATPETYELVRRGGDWARLMNNLEFLGERRREGKFPVLSLNFVVQQRNFREMAAFVELGKRFNADRIFFQPVHNQTESFTQTEFRDADILNPSHPDYTAFQESLYHPLLSDPVVRIGFPRPTDH